MEHVMDLGIVEVSAGNVHWGLLNEKLGMGSTFYRNVMRSV